VVVAQERPTGRQLVGYVVPVSSQLDLFAEDERRRSEARCGHVDALKTFLRATLPDYMVPAHWVVLQQFPLTPNGKLDRKALPTPDADELRRAYVPPETELEQRVAAIWAQLLGVERVGLGDNFFDLGGHSLLAAQVTARLQSELAVNVPLVSLFQAGTLQAYAMSISASTAGNAADLDDLRDFMTELEAV
jgi:acyl carrier protein